MKAKRISKRIRKATLIVSAVASLTLAMLGVFKVGDWTSPVFNFALGILWGVLVSQTIVSGIHSWQKDQEIEKDVSTILDRLSAEEIEAVEQYAERLAEKRSGK